MQIESNLVMNMEYKLLSNLKQQECMIAIDTGNMLVLARVFYNLKIR
jgi:hypothetical protein